MNNQIVIGKIVAPHGVRGDIRILPLTEKPEQFLELDYLLLADGRRLTLKHARFHKRMVLATVAEINSMNEAELLRGQEVLINAGDLPELEEGQFYVADLIGLPVYDEQGAQIGTFKDALTTGSNDVYVIAVPGAKDILLPALKIYVKEINLAEKRIVVTLPEWVDEA
ncbi:MAG: ribosome maturation factor RimM [Phascolarctobacterium sp.]|uniref:ribosome maturation factor RimM n=1 Tax=Phascolarctobacterium sp. TaxID=2049039 RepID=UPI0026DBF415|nr:ribosome maturation factor RimM [Phascolarctobacterium sp.]MDO4921509.1 ribosome maturation factor RimM [Phascolarctobacterium sp.]